MHKIHVGSFLIVDYPSDHNALFSQRLLEILRAHPGGLSEFELLRALEAAGDARFAADQRRDNLSLFQIHFFLFHHLYLLQTQLLQSGETSLEIGPLCIRLQVISKLELLKVKRREVDRHDPLRDYYLDLNNLESTGGEQIEQLLEQFWLKLFKNDRRADALAELGLQDPVSWEEIKAQYRRLVMEHHPDRGGDVARLQVINAALEVLKG